MKTKRKNRIPRNNKQKKGMQLMSNPGITPDNDLLANMVNHIGDELMVINSEGRIIYVNDATVNGLGYQRNQILGRRITDFFKERISIKQWQKSHYAELKKKRKPIKYQIQRKEKGNKSRVIDVTAAYVDYLSEGLIISVARDITGQLDMQFAMKQSEDLYRLICEGAGDAIFIIDMNGKIVYANKVAEIYLKKPKKKIKGANFKDFVHQRSWVKALTFLKKARKSTSRFLIEMDVVSQGGSSIPIEVTVSPLKRNGKTEFIHAIARDIRERKEVEKLEVETQRMEAIQHFISGTVQEINHPLLAILTRTEGLIKEYKQRDFEYISYNEFSTLMKTLESINRQVKYCYDTSRRLVDLNRRKMGLKKGTCNPHRVIKDYMVLISKEMKSQDIRIQYRLSSKIQNIAIGEIELNQIINGIVTNAVQAMPGGGVITFKTTLHSKQRFVDITVSDNGVGIGKDELKLCFEPFFTTKHRGLEGHSGLGLPIVLSLVKGSGGDIIIESNLRKGTSVKLMFPLSGNSSNT